MSRRILQRTSIALRCQIDVRSTHAIVRQIRSSAVSYSEDADAGLLTRLKDELKTSMRAKDSFASTVYRSVLSELQYANKSGGSGATLTSIMQKAIAKRLESSRQFREAKPARDDLADKEEREVSLIKKFLPEELSSQDLESLVEKAVEEAKQNGIEGKKIIGHVMKSIYSQVDKAKAPGARISEAVKKFIE